MRGHLGLHEVLLIVFPGRDRLLVNVGGAVDSHHKVQFLILFLRSCPQHKETDLGLRNNHSKCHHESTPLPGVFIKSSLSVQTK